MARYPVKMLKDENNNPFVPLVSTECVKDPGGQSLDQKLATKLESNNIQAGDNTINVSTSGNNVSITANLPAGSTLIDNLTTTTAGQGALDAHQGKVLKDLIPTIVDDLTSTDATKALSAKQGYILNQKFNDYTLTSALEALIKQYILASHPIGSIEINVSGANPSTYLGGTWEQIKDVFLLSAGDTYTAGSTGGEATHTLTKSEIPNYTIGTIPEVVPAMHGNWNNGGITSSDLGDASSSKPGVENNHGVLEITSGKQWGYEISTDGGGQPHNNMPPYLVVYVWKRTA